jgi:hypothetical protein
MRLAFATTAIALAGSSAQLARWRKIRTTATLAGTVLALKATAAMSAAGVGLMREILALLVRLQTL